MREIVSATPAYATGSLRPMTRPSESSRQAPAVKKTAPAATIAPYFVWCVLKERLRPLVAVFQSPLILPLRAPPCL